MFTLTLDQYSLSVQRGTLPAIYGDYKKHAQLADEFELRPHEGELCFLAVSLTQHWPFLLVAQRFEMSEAGFDPAALLVAETHTLFIGAGRRLLAYRLQPPQRLWEQRCESGFWEWARHGDIVLMSAELEVAAWDASANRLWAMPLEPAWEYHVEGATMHLNVMGRRTAFDIHQGPQKAALER